MTSKIEALRKLAAQKNVGIGTSRDQHGWSYWLLNANGDDLWADDNFFTNRKDLKAAIDQIVAKRAGS